MEEQLVDFWRYEWPGKRKRLGPYTGPKAVRYMAARHNNDNLRPSFYRWVWNQEPWLDQMSRKLKRNLDRTDVICGCPTKRDLTRWFWGFNAKLREAGYVVAHYRYKPDLVYRVPWGLPQLATPWRNEPVERRVL